MRIAIKNRFEIANLNLFETVINFELKRSFTSFYLRFVRVTLFWFTAVFYLENNEKTKINPLGNLFFNICFQIDKKILNVMSQTILIDWYNENALLICRRIYMSIQFKMSNKNNMAIVYNYVMREMQQRVQFSWYNVR